jgi:hypothetical protein
VDDVAVAVACTDGYTEAYYARPERFLDEGVRRARSAWAFVDPAAEARFVEHLSADLASGEWARRDGHHLDPLHLRGLPPPLTAHPEVPSGDERGVGS